jgi:hypothetical protein
MDNKLNIINKNVIRIHFIIHHSKVDIIMTCFYKFQLNKYYFNSWLKFPPLFLLLKHDSVILFV